MFFCKQCGTQLQDGVVFCRKCGTKIGIGTENIIHPSRRNTNSENFKNNYAFAIRGKNSFKELKSKALKIIAKAKEMLEKSKIDKKFAMKLKIGVSATIVGIIAFIAMLTMDKRVSVKDYIVVEVSGYDTLGYVDSYMINKETFCKKVFGKNSEEMEWKETFEISRLLGTIKLSIDNKEALSNGDKVVVNIEYDNELAHEYGIKLVGDTYIFTVSGLEVLKDYNPFENLQVYFSGVDPNANVNYDINDGMLSSYMFTVDKKNGISNGEIITITYSGTENYLEQYGYKISKTSEQYVCEGVSKYVTKSKSLTGDFFEKMKSSAQDCIDSYFANNYENIQCDNLQYVGNYVLTSKDNLNGNIVYLIYSGKVSSKETIEYWDDSLEVYNYKSAFETQTVYFPIGFSNVIVNADQSVTYELISSNIYGTTDLKCGWSKVKGYTNMSTMFNDLVQTQKINYTHDISENLTQSENIEIKGEVGTDILTQAYILSNSNSAYIIEKDLEKLTKEQLRIALNELYARHGYIFNNEELKTYFESKSWYQGTVNSDSFNESVFNEYETVNKDFIAKYMEEKGYR